jgi:hypothetical protein
MDSNTTVLERAFQLAKSGQCATVTEIQQRLSDEGYMTAQITGPMLLKQLRAHIATSQSDAPQPKASAGPGAAADEVRKQNTKQVIDPR